MQSAAGKVGVISGPVAAAVSTTDAKLHLRVDHSDEDAYIDALVTAATNHAQAITSRAFITQTLALYLDSFPLRGEIELYRPPLQSVTSVAYIDQDGSSQTFSSSNYWADANSTPGRIVLDDTASWPSTDTRPNAVTVTYVAGYGDDATDIPEDILQAIYLIVGEWYRNRENSTSVKLTDIPMAADRLLCQHRAAFFA